MQKYLTVEIGPKLSKLAEFVNLLQLPHVRTSRSKQTHRFYLSSLATARDNGIDIEIQNTKKLFF